VVEVILRIRSRRMDGWMDGWMDDTEGVWRMGNGVFAIVGGDEPGGAGCIRWDWTCEYSRTGEGIRYGFHGLSLALPCVPDLTGSAVDVYVVRVYAVLGRSEPYRLWLLALGTMDRRLVLICKLERRW